MPAKPMEPPKPAADAAKGAEAKPAVEAGAKKGGLGAWLPLIASLVLMPAIAYAMTTFVLVPKLKQSLSGEAAEPAAAEAKSSQSSAKSEGHGSAKAESAKSGGAKAADAHKKPEAAKSDPHKSGESKKGEAKKTAEAGGKVKVPLDKIFATIAGSQGSRYLLAKMTLVGPDEEFKDKVDENHDQLIDASIGVLSSKTLQDIEKAGFQNTIKTELIQALNHAMGDDSIQDIYFVELATQ